MGKYSSCRISNIFIVISKINEENSIYLVSLYYSFSTKCRAISMQEPGISSDSKFFSLFLIIRKVSVASDCRQLYECKKSNENIWEYFKRRLENEAFELFYYFKCCVSGRALHFLIFLIIFPCKCYSRMVANSIKFSRATGREPSILENRRNRSQA